MRSIEQADAIGPVLPKTLKTQNPEMAMGPCLPPELDLHASDSELDDTDEPENISIGPTLPPHIRGQSSDEDSYGPRLPSTHNSKTSKGIADNEDSYGPALPPGLTPRVSSSNQNTDNVKDDDDDYGPALPPGYHGEPKGRSLPTKLLSQDEDDDEDVIGPLPWMQSSGEPCGQSAAEEFEARSRAMKNKLTGKDEEKAPERETWMMELPGYSKNFGLGPRTFRKRALPAEADRSGWTDTPADKARKEKERREGKALAKKTKPTAEEVTLSKRDEHLSKQIESFNQTKRAESLMDMHTKEMKRKMEEESDKPKERRAFDRDVDLQVNRFDEARKKTMMKKAAQLGDRFSHSNEKMFL